MSIQCNPLNHTFIVKLRFTGVYLFFLFLILNIDLGYSLVPLGYSLVPLGYSLVPTCILRGRFFVIQYLENLHASHPFGRFIVPLERNQAISVKFCKCVD